MAGLWVKAGPTLIKKHASASDTPRARPRQVLGVSRPCSLQSRPAPPATGTASCCGGMRRSTKLCSTAWNVTAGFSAKASRKASVRCAVSSAISLSYNGLAASSSSSSDVGARWQAQPRLVQWRQRVLKSPDAAGGIARCGISRRGSDNDLLSTLWREVISLAGVARSFSSGAG
jgi:hypothetical protein